MKEVKKTSNNKRRKSKMEQKKEEKSNKKNGKYTVLALDFLLPPELVQSTYNQIQPTC